MTGITPASKLPTKATTTHVAKTPIPPGGLSSKGQMKWVNPKDPEDVRFISMLEGRVMDPESGAPVKPPKS